MKLKQYLNRVVPMGVPKHIAKRMWKNGIPVGMVIKQANKFIKEHELKRDSADASDKEGDSIRGLKEV